MNAFWASILLQGVFLLLPTLKAEEFPSPDHRFNIVCAESIEQEGETYDLHRATIRKGKNTVWEYAALSRALKFSWSPDSRHCLFAQWNGEARDVSLYLITFDEFDAPRLQEIDLRVVHKAIIAPVPQFYNRKGGFAPLDYLEWDNLRWITPAKCQLVFIDRDTGLDSEAKIQIELEKERPKLTILNISDKIANPAK